MTHYEAYRQSSWKDQGTTVVVVVRRRDGVIDAGVFQVDFWCLGVKEAKLEEVQDDADLKALLNIEIPDGDRESMNPGFARKFIEGAVAYAEKLGFSPHSGYRKARRVLSSIKVADGTESFEYGLDGRPCYVKEPYDTPERVNRVVTVLDARLGPEGYSVEGVDEAEYDGGESPEIGLARDTLHDFIVQHPSPAFPTFSDLSGFLAALYVSPGCVPLTKVLPLFLSPAHPEWQTSAIVKEMVGALITFWNHLGDIIDDVSTDSEYGYLIDLHDDDEDGDVLYQHFSYWCRGFMRNIELWPEVWGEALKRPDIQRHLDALRAGAATGGAMQADAAGGPLDEDVLTDAVIALYEAFKNKRQPSDGIGTDFGFSDPAKF